MNTVNQQVIVNHLLNCRTTLAVQSSNPILSLDRPLEGVAGEDWRLLALTDLLGFTSGWCGRGLNVLQSVRTPNSILFPLQQAATLNVNQGLL